MPFKPVDPIGAWVKKAERTGEIKDLPGFGKPIKLDDESHIPYEHRMAHNILKNAGILPPEVEISKKIEDLSKVLESTLSDEIRANMRREIVLLQTELAIKLEKFRKAGI